MHLKFYFVYKRTIVKQSKAAKDMNPEDIVSYTCPFKVPGYSKCGETVLFAFLKKSLYNCAAKLISAFQTQWLETCREFWLRSETDFYLFSLSNKSCNHIKCADEDVNNH